MAAINDFVKHFVKTRYEDVPADAVSAVKQGRAHFELCTKVHGTRRVGAALSAHFDFNCKPPRLHLVASGKIRREAALRVLEETADALSKLPGVEAL